jgi:succinyl-CoA synthetase beta subunit
MDIEEVAHSTPEKIITEFIDPLTGRPHRRSRPKKPPRHRHDRRLRRQAVDVLQKLYKCYMDTDASLVEINPLNRDRQGQHHRAGRQVQLRRQRAVPSPGNRGPRDLDEEDPAEVEASKFDLAYISLDGNIGCLVNGAGLAMATMDTIKLFGAEPANFLDVGGGATPRR